MVIFVDPTGLESTTVLLSLFISVIDGDYPFRPMNLKVTDESIHIVVTSKGSASPQKL
jgi:hypothetical protein